MKLSKLICGGCLLTIVASDGVALRDRLPLGQRIAEADFVVVGTLTTSEESFSISYPKSWGGYFHGNTVSYATGYISVDDILQGDQWFDTITVFFYHGTQDSEGRPVESSAFRVLEFPEGEKGIWILHRRELVGAYELLWDDYYLPLDSLAAVSRFATLERVRREQE